MIDDRPLEVFIENLQINYLSGRGPLYAKMCQTLVYDEDYVKMVVVKINDPARRITMCKSFGSLIHDYKTFGTHDDHLIAVTQDGWIINYLYKFGKLEHHGKNSGSIIGKHRIDLLEDRGERCLSIAVG